jgi:bifunctional non-homologous end joining protein LigD
MKYDGRRKQIQKTKSGILTYNKKGELVSFDGSPSAVDFNSLPGTFILDGEQIGNIFYAFDIFELNGVVLANRPYEERFETLKQLIYPSLKFVKVAETFGSLSSHKLAAFMNYVEHRAEGVVFKLRSAPYRAGRNGQHKKFKFLKTASVVVLEVNPKPGKESMSIGLISDPSTKWGHSVPAALVPVGHCSLLGKPKVKVGDVVEIIYLYATKDHRLYQPRMKEIRTDVSQSECTFSQLVYKGGE